MGLAICATATNVIELIEDLLVLVVESVELDFPLDLFVEINLALFLESLVELFAERREKHWVLLLSQSCDGNAVLHQYVLNGLIYSIGWSSWLVGRYFGNRRIVLQRFLLLDVHLLVLWTDALLLPDEAVILLPQPVHVFHQMIASLLMNAALLRIALWRRLVRR